MIKRLKWLGAAMAIIGLGFIGVGVFAGLQVKAGNDSLQAFSAAQNVTLTDNDDGQLVDRGEVDDVTVRLVFMVVADAQLRRSLGDREPLGSGDDRLGRHDVSEDGVATQAGALDERHLRTCLDRDDRRLVSAWSAADDHHSLSHGSIVSHRDLRHES